MRRVCVALVLVLAGCEADCGSDYEAPRQVDCERAGGVLLPQYKSGSICIRREAVIDVRELGRHEESR